MAKYISVNLEVVFFFFHFFLFLMLSLHSAWSWLEYHHVKPVSFHCVVQNKIALKDSQARMSQNLLGMFGSVDSSKLLS